MTRAGIGGFLTAIPWVIVCVLSLRPQRIPLAAFFALVAVASLAWLWTYLTLPEKITRGTFRTILFWSLAIRLAGLLGAPVYEDDYYRYLWDGRTFALTGSPYGVPPSASFGDDSLPPDFGEILGRINYPDIPTIYGPVAEFSFLAAYWIAPGKLWALKLLYLFADLGTLAILWRMMPGSRRIILYAWSPLLIKEIAFTAHTDILGALLCVAAAALALSGRQVWAGVSMGASVAARLTVGVVAPVILGVRPPSWLALGLATVTCYFPFIARASAERAGLGAFAAEWEFNSFLYGAVSSAAGRTAAAIASILVLAGFFAFAALRKKSWLRPDIVFAVFFLAAPVVNPWYLVVIVPFVALHPTGWGIGATLAVLISYATGLNMARADLGFYDHPWWVRPLELALVGGFAWAGRSWGEAAGQGGGVD